MNSELPAERLLRQMRGIVHAPRASSYAGVTWNVKMGRWCVRLQRAGKAVYRPCESEEEAARIYDVAVQLLWEKVPADDLPPNCPLRKPPNFPDRQPPKGICRARIKQWLIDAELI